MATSTSRRCDACGLPPRLAADQETLLPLRRCSRCHKVYYHDVECQRRHRSQHKKSCRRATIICADEHDTTTASSSPLYHVEERPNKGRCLVACQTIPAGQQITADAFPPLVPPVLNQANRHTRCALCFTRLNPSSILLYEGNVHLQQYPVLFCSEVCRQEGQACHLDEEEQLVALLLKSNPRIQILSSAILLFRILRNMVAQEEASSQELLLRNKVESLQAHDDNLCTTEQEKHHVKAVITLVTSLIDRLREEKVVNEQEKLLLEESFSIDYMRRTLSRIKTNGFSISDGESVALGVGLFSGEASNMNHSCRPNVLQTFDYGNIGKYPCLRVTACTPIQANDEICISYMDSASPREARRERLEKDYHFMCTCSACTDDRYNDKLVGLTCPRAGGCTGTVIKPTSPQTKAPGSSLNANDKASWQCDKCGNTDFDTAIDLMRTFHAQNEKPESTIQEQERLYTCLKANFTPSSWYVAECGEQLAQSLLDAINEQADARETQQLCARTLAVFDELLGTSEQDTHTPWKVLKRQVLLCKRAKLRLFLFPDPRMAISELESVMETVSIYYPKDHEFMQEIQNTMAQAFS